MLIIVVFDAFAKPFNTTSYKYSDINIFLNRYTIMKKILLLAVLAVSSCGFAQVSLIPKVGVNFANAVLNESNLLEGGKSSLTGLTGGLGFNFSLTGDNFLSVQPEILYSQKGFSSAATGVINYEGDYRLNYLEIPLLVKVNFGGEKLKLYVNAGPSVGYLLNGKVDGRGNFLGVIGASLEESIDFTDSPTPGDITELDANRIEAGLNFGGGLGYAILGNAALFVDLRYNMGLTDFNNQEQSKNRVFALTAGVQIPLGE
jgi:hypothetical protein